MRCLGRQLRKSQIGRQAQVRRDIFGIPPFGYSPEQEDLSSQLFLPQSRAPPPRSDKKCHAVHLSAPPLRIVCQPPQKSGELDRTGACARSEDSPAPARGYGLGEAPSERESSSVGGPAIASARALQPWL